MLFKFLSLALISSLLFSCGPSEPKPENTSLKNMPIKEQLKKVDLMAGVPFKKLPFTDSTSFDNFEGKTPLSKEIVSQLKLTSEDP